MEIQALYQLLGQDKFQNYRETGTKNDHANTTVTRD